MPTTHQHPTLVKKAAFRPGKCLVTGDIDGPFIDAGIWNKHINQEGERFYLHAPWVEQVARDILGMVPRSDLEDLEAQLDALKQKYEDVEKVADLIEKREAVNREIEEVVA